MSERQLNEARLKWRLKGLIPAASALFLEVKKGEQLIVTDVEGGQSASLYCVFQADPSDGFSASRSIDYNKSIYLSKGNTLYSGLSRPMLALVDDTSPSGKHDLFLGPCSLEMFQRLSGSKEYHPSCQENLRLAFHSHGHAVFWIPNTFNIFSNVSVNTEGRVSISPPKSRANDMIQLEVLQDLFVGLSACADESANGGVTKSIEYEVRPVASAP